MIYIECNPHYIARKANKSAGAATKENGQRERKETKIRRKGTETFTEYYTKV